MTLSHSRILSSESLSKNTANANATVNLHIDPSADEIKVNYPSNDSPYAGLSENTNKEKVLSLLLEAYANNPVFLNKFVIMQNEKLIEVVKLLTGADAVDIEYSTDIDCCGKPSKFNSIGGIVIIHDGKRTDFEITYNDSYRLLKDYHISTKFTHD